MNALSSLHGTSASFRSDTPLSRSLSLLLWATDVLVLLCYVYSSSIEVINLTPRSGELRTLKLKSHLLKTHSLNVLFLKPGVGQYIALHATLTARDFFLAYFYPSGPFTCIFSETFPDFFLFCCG